MSIKHFPGKLVSITDQTAYRHARNKYVPADLIRHVRLEAGLLTLCVESLLLVAYCNATVISERFALTGQLRRLYRCNIHFPPASPPLPNVKALSTALFRSRISEKRGISVGKCHEDRLAAGGHILPINLPLSIERKKAGGREGGREWKEDGEKEWVVVVASMDCIRVGVRARVGKVAVPSYLTRIANHSCHWPSDRLF